VSEDQIMDVLRAALWTAFMISLPILFVSLIVGTAIGLFQALTSVQEMTLTFVPKLGAIFVVFWLTLGFVGQTLVSFYKAQIITAIERQ